MGYIAHDAVIATVYVGDQEAIEARVNGLRESLDPAFAALIVGPIQSAINDHPTYFLAPDGSKAGWEDSDRGDRLREQFAGCFLGDGAVDVVTVRFGGDFRTEIERPVAEYVGEWS